MGDITDKEPREFRREFYEGVKELERLAVDISGQASINFADANFTARLQQYAQLNQDLSGYACHTPMHGNRAGERLKNVYHETNKAPAAHFVNGLLHAHSGYKRMHK